LLDSLLQENALKEYVNLKEYSLNFSGRRGTGQDDPDY